MSPAFEVDSASQDAEGIERFLRATEAGCPPAVAFIDLRMPPRIDGIDQVLILKKPFTGIEVLQLPSALTQKWELARVANARFAEIEQLVAVRTSALLAANCELADANARLAAEMDQRQEPEQFLLRAQRLGSIGTLASGVAHDLNNALSPILIASELLRHGLPRAEHEELGSIIAASAGRAAGVVRQVLSFARDGGGKPQLLQSHFLIREM